MFAFLPVPSFNNVASFHTVSCEQGPSSYGIPNITLLIMETIWGAVSSLSFSINFSAVLMVLCVLAAACEMIAKQVIHDMPFDRQMEIMSSRFRHRQVDGDLSDMSSALELAIDSHW
jgi:hypothetical protein